MPSLIEAAGAVIRPSIPQRQDSGDHKSLQNNLHGRYARARIRGHAVEVPPRDDAQETVSEEHDSVT